MALRRSEQRKRLGWGAGSALTMSLVAFGIWGSVGAPAALMMGLMATVLQLVAVRQMARTGRPAELDHLKVYLIGVVLRFGGVLMLGLVVTLEPRRFPPLPSALGYLGTVLPLLYLETRLTR
jgi:hypothetical protein